MFELKSILRHVDGWLRAPACHLHVKTVGTATCSFPNVTHGLFEEKI